MEREQQYMRKAEYILEMVSLFKKPTNRDQRDALFYRIETAVEASMDIIAMLVRDYGNKVQDDYHNLNTLQEEKIINSIKHLLPYFKRSPPTILTASGFLKSA